MQAKLDVLIKLTATNVIKEDKNQTESILKLNSMGIGYKDIAKILNATDNYGYNAYLNAALAEDDPRVFPLALRDIIEAGNSSFFENNRKAVY